MDARDEPVDTRVKDVLQTKETPRESPDVLTTDPSATVYECIARMVDRDVGSIIVTEGNDIAGIFTERDYMRNIALKGRTSKETPVRKVMTKAVATVQAETTLEECLERMSELKCRHLPVVDEEGTLEDILSMRDCAERILGAAKNEVIQLRNYVTGGYST
ncbi:MAG: CBS domain-containing protein [Salinibacter sp.]